MKRGSGSGFGFGRKNLNYHYIDEPNPPGGYNAALHIFFTVTTWMVCPDLG